MSQETVSCFLSSPFSFIFLSLYFPCWNWKKKPIVFHSSTFTKQCHKENGVKWVKSLSFIETKHVSRLYLPGEIIGEFITAHLIYRSVCFNYWLVCFFLDAYASKTPWDFLIFTLVLIAVLMFLGCFLPSQLKNCSASSTKRLQNYFFLLQNNYLFVLILQTWQ